MIILIDLFKGNFINMITLGWLSREGIFNFPKDTLLAISFDQFICLGNFGGKFMIEPTSG